MDAHICIASLCHDKNKALQYLAGEAALTDKTAPLVEFLYALTLLYFSFIVNIVHGGHVLDSADLEVVESVAKTCLSSESPPSGRGPHILSNIIDPGHFGNQTTF